MRRARAEMKGGCSSKACKSCKTCHPVMVNLCDDEDDEEDFKVFKKQKKDDEVSKADEQSDLFGFGTTPWYQAGPQGLYMRK